MSNVTTAQSLYRSTPRQAKEYVLDVLYAGLVPFLQSSPGLGKSSIMREIAKELNLFLIDHRLSTSPPEDLSGLPDFKDGYAYFAPFRELFPLADAKVPEGYDGWLIFLDEFNSAKKDTQAAAYKLILDRMVGQHKLHDQCLVAAAGNLSTDRAIVNPLSTAMQSRVVHIEMVESYDEWVADVALPQKYDTRVIAYLSQYPSRLMDFKPDHTDKTFACPRTWEFTNRLIKGKKDLSGKTTLLAGTITAGIAADFVTFSAVFDSIPKIAEIMADPSNHFIPRDTSTKWATVSSLLEHVDKDTIKDLAIYANRFDMSFRILFFRSVMVNNPSLRQSPPFVQAMLDLAKYLKD